MSASTVLLSALGAGVAGWAAENALQQLRARNLNEPAPATHYSRALPGIPFLPVYAAGGAFVALTAPYLSQELSPVELFIVYGMSLSAIEYVGGRVDRALYPNLPPAWQYPKNAPPGQGSSTDIPHGLLWGLLGVGLSELVVR